MNAAIQAVVGGSMNQRQASKEYHVARATLHKFLTGKTHFGAKPGKKHFSELQELETKLVDYAGNRASLGIGFGKSQFLNYAGQLAKNTKSC